MDSSYRMINLPEYIGDLCDYNITSSVHSSMSRYMDMIFRVLQEK